MTKRKLLTFVFVVVSLVMILGLWAVTTFVYWLGGGTFERSPGFAVLVLINAHWVFLVTKTLFKHHSNSLKVLQEREHQQELNSVQPEFHE